MMISGFRHDLTLADLEVPVDYSWNIGLGTTGTDVPSTSSSKIYAPTHALMVEWLATPLVMLFSWSFGV